MGRHWRPEPAPPPDGPFWRGMWHAVLIELAALALLVGVVLIVTG